MLSTWVVLFLWMLLFAVPVWFWLGAVAAVTAALVVALVHGALGVYRAHRLERWLSGSDWQADLNWPGIWGEIGRRIQKLLAQRESQWRNEKQRLQHFLEAIQASPNGVTLLDAQGRIEWCNDTAASHLGLDVQRDILQHVVHLVRDPVFAKYHAQKDHDSEVVIEGRSTALGSSLKLSVQLHAFGEGRQLLLTRDITSIALAEAMRRDFVANVSHEIRTPLTVLGGFVETLQTIPLSEQETQRYLHLMSVQADRMQALVSDLLTLSQLEGSSPPGLQERTALPQFMDQVAADARALSAVLAKSDGEERQPVHVLVFDPTPNWIFLGARAELLSAVSNLVSNAIRYTPAGGRVHVTWQVRDHALVLSVTDSGPGIAPEHLPRLAERFYRVDRSRSRETGGTGLGLAITKHVAQRHGGELRIESRVGQGSCFMLVFPRSRLESVSV